MTATTRPMRWTTIVEDGVTTVTNRLETTRIYADKIWNKGIKDKQTLTFELKYLDEDGETWRSFVPCGHSNAGRYS